MFNLNTKQSGGVDISDAGQDKDGYAAKGPGREGLSSHLMIGICQARTNLQSKSSYVGLILQLATIHQTLP